MTAAEPRFIYGTEGNQDYLVVGSKDGMVVAVKAIVDSGLPFFPMMALGVRVRCTTDEGQTVASVPHMASKTYPNIPWVKKEDTHTSLVWAMKGEHPANFNAYLKVLQEGVWPTVAKQLDDHIKPVSTETPFPEVLEWLKTQFEVKGKAIFAKSSKSSKSPDKTPQADDDSDIDSEADTSDAPKADVLSFFNPEK
jgi:hypothetical protein